MLKAFSLAAILFYRTCNLPDREAGLVEGGVQAECKIFTQTSCPLQILHAPKRAKFGLDFRPSRL